MTAEATLWGLLDALSRGEHDYVTGDGGTVKVVALLEDAVQRGFLVACGFGGQYERRLQLLNGKVFLYQPHELTAAGVAHLTKLTLRRNAKVIAKPPRWYG